MPRTKLTAAAVERIGPPATGLAVLHVDDVRLYEWRAATELPPGLYPATAIRAETPGAPITRTVRQTEN